MYEREDIDRARRHQAVPAAAQLHGYDSVRLERMVGLFLWAALLVVVFAVSAQG